MGNVFSEIKNAKRKKLIFGSQALYRLIRPINESELDEIENKYSFSFPSDIMRSLVGLGSCTIAGELNLHQPKEIYPLDADNLSLQGYIVFASDTSGNYFVFDPKSSDEQIYFYSHDPLGFYPLESSFEEFLGLFIKNNYEIEGVIEHSKLRTIV